MTSYICIMIALLIPILCSAYAKFFQKGYDNRYPKKYLETLKGRGLRAHYAQQNSWEAFAPFSISVLAAHQLGARVSLINFLCLIFVSARFSYCYFYINDRNTPRSVAWLVGFLSILALFIVGL